MRKSSEQTQSPSDAFIYIYSKPIILSKAFTNIPKIIHL